MKTIKLLIRFWNQITTLIVVLVGIIGLAPWKVKTPEDFISIQKLQ